MITIPSTIVDLSMTLVLAAYNKDSIVIGSDSLYGKKRDDGSGITDLRYDAQKIYECGNWAILLAGAWFKLEQVDQFLVGFRRFIKSKKMYNVEDIAKELKIVSKEDILPNIWGHNKPDADIQFLLAGYKAADPKIYMLRSANRFKIEPVSKSYQAAGQEEFGMDKLEDLKVNENMATDELIESVTKVLELGKKELSVVGGELKVKTLKP
jgi:20S proteasome alpha/beta subunit